MNAESKLTLREELKQKTFETEAEEADWWFTHEDALVDEFERAAADGTLGRGTAAAKGNTPTTTIRLDPGDIARARVQAEHLGIRYQTYLKNIIHEALNSAEQSTPGVR